ncbi:MAG: hypothetical protein JWM85_2680, partial [Acidimicrobiaceae bacterium]|nr:hypothetical protein [Acidimicrobiaceae bacterium]
MLSRLIIAPAMLLGIPLAATPGTVHPAAPTHVGSPVPGERCFRHVPRQGSPYFNCWASSSTSTKTATQTRSVTVSKSTPAVAKSATAGPVGDPGTWHSVLDQEFNGTSLDTSRWTSGWFGSGITQPVNSEELECYSPTRVSVSGGSLRLSLIAQAHTCGGVLRPYTSGIVTTDSKFSYTYGFAEARVYLPATGSGTADWPAFWGDGQSWPKDGEMDIMEGLGVENHGVPGNACYHFISPKGNPGGCPPGKDFA